MLLFFYRESISFFVWDFYNFSRIKYTWLFLYRASALYLNLMLLRRAPTIFRYTQIPDQLKFITPSYLDALLKKHNVIPQRKWIEQVEWYFHSTFPEIFPLKFFQNCKHERLIWLIEMILPSFSKNNYWLKLSDILISHEFISETPLERLFRMRRGVTNFWISLLNSLTNFLADFVG